MKKQKFLKYLNHHECYLHRHGSSHDIVKNQKTGKKTTIPCHTELDNKLCKLICKQLKIPDPF